MPEVSTRTIAGRYRLDEVIGRGGAGVVWRAEDTLLRREVAVKEVEVHQQRDRVLREARAAARVSHPRLVTMFDVVEEGGRIYLVQELVRGGSLKDEVAANGPLSPRRAADVGSQLLAALDVLHREGIVHRDVKPGNVMFATDGTVKLADLGIAAVAGDPDLTATGVVLGSPNYMAPEQARGERVTPAADLWSLGATLFYAVEGRPPFEGPAIAAMTKIVHDPAPLATHGGSISSVIDRLLAKGPSERPSDDELRRLLDIDAAPTVIAPTDATATLTPAPPTMPTVPDVRRPRAGRALWPVAALLIVLLFGGVALAAMRGTGDQGGDASSTSTPPASTAAPTKGKSTVPRSTSTSTSPASTATAAATGDRYRNEAAGYSIAVPDGWKVQPRRGSAVDLTEPGSGTYLRIDWTDKPGPSALAAWQQQEQSFSQNHQNYQRVRMEETTYKDRPAALWEYTYTAGGTQLHAYNLGFTTPDRGFALNFQTHEDRWSAAQPAWERLSGDFTFG